VPEWRFVLAGEADFEPLPAFEAHYERSGRPT
jgi:hypothetical protein